MDIFPMHTCPVHFTSNPRPPPLLSPGINIFLDGYVPTENLRFREISLVFKVM